MTSNLLENVQMKNVQMKMFTATGPDQRLYTHMIQMHLDILEIISRMSFSAVNVIVF